MGAYKLTNLIVKEVSMPFLSNIKLAVWRNMNVTNRYLFDDHIGQMVKY